MSPISRSLLYVNNSYQNVGNRVGEESFSVKHISQHLSGRRGGNVLIVGVLVDLKKTTG
jgi:hypothetical protein